MKFGVREICDVVLKAKAAQKVGDKVFYKNEPVIYFDTLKTSSMEGAATTVYAQGGRGNSRLVAWEGERTVTFTMEDALISPAGFMILSGAGLIQGSKNKTIKVHTTEQTEDELKLIVDLGGTVADVFVWHKAYGKMEATLNISSRAQIEQFIESVRSGKSVELMHITGGFHYHTVRANSEEILDKIGAALEKRNYIAPGN